MSNPVRAGDLRWFRVDIDGRWAYLVSDVMIPGADGIEGPGYPVRMADGRRGYVASNFLRRA